MPTVWVARGRVVPLVVTLPVLLLSAASSVDAATRFSSAGLNVMLEVTGVDLRPPVSVTVSVTAYVPAAAYVCVVLEVGAVVTTADVPSPKLKL
jgi:hypothetical protein